jgi:hypothetical protein
MAKQLMPAPVAMRKEDGSIWIRPAGNRTRPSRFDKLGCAGAWGKTGDVSPVRKHRDFSQRPWMVSWATLESAALRVFPAICRFLSNPRAVNLLFQSRSGRVPDV